MNTAITFTATVATALRAASIIPPDVTIYSQHQRPSDLARPALAILMEAEEGPHPMLVHGRLAFRYLSDADHESSATATNNLQLAVDWIISPSGRQILRDALAVSGIWPRIIFPQGSATGEDGERTRFYQSDVNVWLQIGLP